jgi:hypothetical protein
MPRRYTYTGEEGRYYPTLGITPEPGSRHQLDHNPGDGDWTPPDPEPTPEPEAPAEVAAAAQTKEGSDA